MTDFYAEPSLEPMATEQSASAAPTASPTPGEPPASPGIGVHAPTPNLKGGVLKLSKKRKLMIGGGVVVAALAMALALSQDPNKTAAGNTNGGSSEFPAQPAPQSNATQHPPGQLGVTVQPGQGGGDSTQDQGSLVMDSSPNSPSPAVPQNVAVDAKRATPTPTTPIPTQATIVAQPGGQLQERGRAAGQSSTSAGGTEAAQQPSGAINSPSTVGVTNATVPVSGTSTVPSSQNRTQTISTDSSSASALAASRTNQYERLAARVADLEAKISTLEAQRATPKSNAKAATDKAGELRQSGDQKGHKATPVAKAAKADVESHASHPAGVGMRAEATSAGFADNRSNQAQVFAQSKAMQTDQVHVLGGTSKPGGNVALIEFGGVKQRAAVGDTIAGLGLVTNIAISNGVTIVEINGVTYR